MSEFNEDGEIELSGGYCLEHPDDDGTIRCRDQHGDTTDVRLPGDDGYEDWYSMFDIDIAEFNRRWNRNLHQYNLNIRMKREELWRDRDEFLSAQDESEKVTSGLLLELERSNQNWRVCSRSICFQHPTDNHEADSRGQQRFPYAQWDSESGQGFVFCNEQFEGDVVDWLEKIGCTKISSRESTDFSYLSDASVHHPVLPLTA